MCLSGVCVYVCVRVCGTILVSLCNVRASKRIRFVANGLFFGAKVCISSLGFATGYNVLKGKVSEFDMWDARCRFP